MAWVKVQSVTGNGATIVLNGVVAGNALSCISSLFRSPTTGAVFGTPTDSNGTFSTVSNDAPQTEATLGDTGASSWAEQNAASGTHTVTIPTNNGHNSVVTEWSGGSTTNLIGTSKSAKTGKGSQLSQVTGTTDGTPNVGDLALICLCLADAVGGSTNVGLTDPVTNYTTLQLGNNSATDVATQQSYQVLTSGGAQSATFNWTFNDAGQVDMASIGILKAPAVGGVGVIANLSSSWHPGRSPGLGGISSARFWQPPWSGANPAVTVTLTGAGATFTPGTVGVTHTNALTGAKATFTPGTVGVSHTQPLTGQRATFAAGTLGVTHTEALVGQRATFTPGVVSSALSVPLAGSKATFGAGTVTPVTGIFVALTGASATFSAGILAAQGGDVPSVSTPSVSTVGGISQWTIQIPRLPEKKRITFVRNMENMDRNDIADIISFLRRL